MTGYSCNSTYDSANLQRCTDDLYIKDDVERSYETYMDYWCDLLYDSSKFDRNCAKVRLHNVTPLSHTCTFLVCLLDPAVTAAVHSWVLRVQFSSQRQCMLGTIKDMCM